MNIETTLRLTMRMTASATMRRVIIIVYEAPLGLAFTPHYTLRKLSLRVYGTYRTISMLLTCRFILFTVYTTTNIHTSMMCDEAAASAQHNTTYICGE